MEYAKLPWKRSYSTKVTVDDEKGEADLAWISERENDYLRCIWRSCKV